MTSFREQQIQYKRNHDIRPNGHKTGKNIRIQYSLKNSHLGCSNLSLRLNDILHRIMLPSANIRNAQSHIQSHIIDTHMYMYHSFYDHIVNNKIYEKKTKSSTHIASYQLRVKRKYRPTRSNNHIHATYSLPPPPLPG